MSKSRHTEAQLITALKQLEADRKVEDVAREYGVSKHTIYAWKAKYGEDGNSEDTGRSGSVNQAIFHHELAQTRFSFIEFLRRQHSNQRGVLVCAGDILTWTSNILSPVVARIPCGRFGGM
jgi:transposase-like protein